MGILRAEPRPVSCSDIKWRIYANLDGASWTDISRDVIDDGVAWDRGIDGGGPNDRTARSGTLTFSLNNSHVNEAGILGRWSPGHRMCRLGWDIGTPLRLDIGFRGRFVTQWVGRADEITPEHGILGTRRVWVKAKDFMEELAEHKLKNLPTLDNVTAPEVLQAILDAMPIQPPGGTVFDEGVDVFPLVFDDVRDGRTTGMSEIAKLNRSDSSFTFVTKEGAIRYQNGASRRASTHNLFVLDGTMRDVTVTRSRRNRPNRIEVTVHPRRVDTNYAVLAALDGATAIGPGETLPVRLEYVDPENPGERIGAVDIQVPLVAGQDYIGSVQQAVATGTPDAPATLVPDAAGFYSGGSSGTPASLSDGSDSTGYSAISPGVRQSVTLSNLTAPSNAAVDAVRIPVRVKHSPQGVGGFFVLYVEARLNGIDTPVFLTGTAINHLSAESATPGVYAGTFEVPLPPGGGAWNAGAANELEIVWRWNWSGDLSALPLLTALGVTLLVASAVEDTDRTADLVVTAPDGAGGNATDFLVQNTSTSPLFLVRMQVRGRPVREYEPKTTFAEDAASIAAIGEKLVTVDQSHQADPAKGKLTAKYLLYLYGAAGDRAEQVQFLANLSEEHMNAALDREIGDRIGVAEEVTGLSAFTADGKPKGWHIQGVAGRILPGPVIEMTWSLAPADSRKYWRAGIAGQTEVGNLVVGPS